MHLKKYLSEEQRIFLQNYNLDKVIEEVLVKMDKQEISKDETRKEISKILQGAIKTSNENNLVAVICEGEHQLYKFLGRERQGEAVQIIEEYSKLLGKQNILVELLWNAGFEINQRLIEICRECGVRAVISPNPRYINADEEEAYKSVLAIGEQKKLSEIEVRRVYDLPTVDQIKEKFKDLISKYPEILVLQDDPILQSWNCKVRTDYGAFASEAYFPIVDLKSFDVSPEGEGDDIDGKEGFDNKTDTKNTLKSKDDLDDSKNYSDYLAWEAYIGLLEKIAKIPEDYKDR